MEKVSYLQSVFFKWQLLFQLLLIVLVVVLPSHFSGPIIYAIAFLLLIFLGIPHGANDVLYQKRKGLKSTSVFIAKYLGAMVAYLLIWCYFPIVAFVLFFLFTFHHFGQSNFEMPHWWYLPSLLWGFLIIAAPVLFHWDTALAIFSNMLGYNLAAALPFSVSYLIISGIVIGYLMSLVITEKKHLVPLSLQLLSVLIWLFVSELLVGFIIVFCLWHSGQSLRYQWDFYRRQLKGSTKTFFLNMFFYTLISFAFLAALHQFLPLQIHHLFILLSIISLPHVVVMHGIYQSK
jgi:beta-carotene 15,15'-dioxygenase